MFRIRKFLGLSDPDPLFIGTDPDPSDHLSLSKNRKKNLNFYWFVTSLWPLCLKNDVNVTSKSNKQKNFMHICSRPKRGKEFWKQWLQNRTRGYGGAHLEIRRTMKLWKLPRHSPRGPTDIMERLLKSSSPSSFSMGSITRFLFGLFLPAEIETDKFP